MFLQCSIIFDCDHVQNCNLYFTICLKYKLYLGCPLCFHENKLFCEKRKNNTVFYYLPY